MSSAARVQRHRKQRSAEGLRRYEFVLTSVEADRVREFLKRERVRATFARSTESPTPEQVAIDPRLGQGPWPNETWSDYIAFAQAGVSRGDPDDAVIERDRTPSPVYQMDWD